MHASDVIKKSRRLRKKLRRKSSPHSPTRQEEIRNMLSELKEASLPNRRLASMVQWHSIRVTQETAIFETTRQLAGERRALRKMLR